MAALLLVAFVLAAIFAPLVAPVDPNRQDLLARLKPPGTEIRDTFYLLGTDELGRDIFSRIIHGSRVSLLIAITSVFLSLIIGTTLGVMAGYFRGWVEGIIMRFADVVLSVPALLLAIITVIVLEPGLLSLIAVLGFTRWPRYTRVAYGQTLGVATRPYVMAARFHGAGAFWLMSRHILPNILSRPWHSTAHRKLGRNDERRKKLSEHGLVDCDLSRPMPFHVGPLCKPSWRHNARPIRPKE
jgi:peptide/nickel transport system permease protein